MILMILQTCRATVTVAPKRHAGVHAGAGVVRERALAPLFNVTSTPVVLLLCVHHLSSEVVS